MSLREELLDRRRSYRRPDPPAVLGGDELYEYFLRRGISRETVDRHRVILTERWSPDEGKLIPCIGFQYFVGGELVNCKYRALHKKAFTMERGAERVFYGIDTLGESDELIICEGEIDALSLWEVGFASVISFPDGAPPPGAKQVSAKLGVFDRIADAVIAAKRVVIAVDGDEPGERLAELILERVDREKCARVRWPEGCKDANDVLVRYGREALVRCIREAEPYPLSGVFFVDEVMDRVWDIYYRGLPHGYSTGFEHLDRGYRSYPGTLTIVTGIPSSGKSFFIDNLVVNLARLHGWRFAFYSPENYPTEHHVSRLLSIYAGKPFGRDRSAIAPEEVESALWWLRDHVCFIYPEETTIQEIIGRAKAVRTRFGMNGLIIDPWNEIERSLEKGVSEVQYISDCLSELRNFARWYGLEVWLVAHPTKLRRLDDGTYPVPTPYDISGASHFYNKADWCIAVHRDQDDEGGLVQVYIQKARFAHLGRRGRVDFAFDRETGRFSSVSWSPPGVGR